MVKNLYVDAGHFMFWPCKCGHVYGRHGGELFSGKMFECFDCKSEWGHKPIPKEQQCKKFFPAMTFEKYNALAKGKPVFSLISRFDGSFLESQNIKGDR